MSSSLCVLPGMGSARVYSRNTKILQNTHNSISNYLDCYIIEIPFTHLYLEPITTQIGSYIFEHTYKYLCVK